MNTFPNKSTKIYASFSEQPGNFGSYRMNTWFKSFGFNALYKSFYLGRGQTGEAIKACRLLGFSGACLAIPHKLDALKFLDAKHELVEKIGACNTIVFNDGKTTGYNTDCLGLISFVNLLKLPENTKFGIIGNGGFSLAVQFALNHLKFPFEVFARKLGNLDGLGNNDCQVIFNATPLEFSFPDKLYIDGRGQSKDGQIISFFQSCYQFNLFTGIDPSLLTDPTHENS